MSDTVSTASQLYADEQAGIPGAVVVRRAVRDELGFDPALADVRRIRRLIERFGQGEDNVVGLIEGASDPVTTAVAVETSTAIERARRTIASTLDDLRASDAPGSVIRRLLVALHRIDVAQDYRMLELQGAMEHQVSTAIEILDEVATEIRFEHAESAFGLAVARSSLTCASAAFKELLGERDSNCAAKLSAVVAKLDCVQAAIGSVQGELDLLSLGDPACPSVEWAEGAEGDDDVTFLGFVDLVERWSGRLVHLLDLAGSDGAAETAYQLQSLQRLLRGDGGSPRDVVIPGEGDVQGLSRSLEALDRALDDARADAEAAAAACGPPAGGQGEPETGGEASAAESKGATTARPRGRSSSATTARRRGRSSSAK